MNAAPSKFHSVILYKIVSSAFIQFSNKEKNLSLKKSRKYCPFYFPFLSEGENKESGRYIL